MLVLYITAAAFLVGGGILMAANKIADQDTRRYY